VKRPHPASLIVLLLLVAACTSAPATSQRAATAQTVASQGGMSVEILTAGSFDLLAYRRPADRASQAIVYIEGDGLGYISKSQPSNDPTPVDPVMLRLAVVDPRPGVAYLARPCQYTGGENARNCQTDLWTLGRFSEEAVAATSLAIDQLKAQSGAARVALIGYSGGGVIALLVAARRQDVDWIITVASPLDIDAFTAYHKVATMQGSLNPVSYARTLSRIPQIHYAGQDDKVVPATVMRSYLAALPHIECAKLRVEKDVDHHQGWLSVWSRLSPTIPSCMK